MDLIKEPKLKNKMLLSILFSFLSLGIIIGWMLTTVLDNVKTPSDLGLLLIIPMVLFCAIFIHYVRKHDRLKDEKPNNRGDKQ